MRSDWPINGTTGYDYLNEVGGLFVDSSNEAEFNRIYHEFTDETTDYAEVCRDKKHLVLNELLGSDVNRLTALLVDVFEQHRARRDYTRTDARRVLREFVACFPIYRTYVVPERGEMTPDDERYINEAAELAKKNRSELDPELIDFVRDLLVLKVTGDLESEFVMRFQQFTGPAMAKGAEDTAFYCFNRLTSLNEVGGDPGRFGSSPEQFHRFNCRAQKAHPATMLASSTHDTKRSEDVRARISLLSEIPAEWEKTLNEWAAANKEFKAAGSPDANTEYLIYQTMIGAWPIEKERLLAYMEKAMREAKRKTSWMAPNEEFEKGTRKFIEGLYTSDTFLRSLAALVARLLEPGRINSLAATLLKMTSPGIPDIYQGTEIWDLSLVDPDNRRPVDYVERRRLLSALKTLKPAQIMQRMDEGLPKLWTVTQALKLRSNHADWFGAKGEYSPVPAKGELRESVVAYLRAQKAMVVVPRLVMNTRKSGWGDTYIDLPPGNWNNLLSGEAEKAGKVAISQLLETFPVALLINETDA